MQAAPDPPAIRLKEGRFARLEAIEWWDQARLANARVLVIGAGALGNEILKNLALLGVGHVVVADMDRVELSNLSRSVLLREEDEGRPKAECVARAARLIFGGMRIEPVVGNILADLGLGFFRWADVVVAALDNREARLFVNSACARVGRPWFDGGIEILQGVARGFAPPGTACYECTMGQADWDLLNQRRSCSLLARRALAQRGTPTTPTTASVVAALQVQEVVKHLHGLPALLGRGVVFDGAGHSSFAVSYPIAKDCPWHEPAPPIEALPFTSDTKLETIWTQAARRLGGVEALDLSRELVERLECPGCGHRHVVLRPAEKVTEAQATCPACHTECSPVFVHSLDEHSRLLRKTVRELGLPAWDVLWARRGTEVIGLEIAADHPWSSGTDDASASER